MRYDVRPWKLLLPGLALLAAGCAATALRPTTLPDPGVAVAPTAGFGSLSLSVRWPELQTQAIPLSTTKIEADLIDGSGTFVASASVTRTSPSTTLARILAGTYKVNVDAKRQDGTLIASGSAPVTVTPNRLAPLTVSVTPVYQPSLDSISPTQGPANSTLYLYGSNLMASGGASWSVLVDNLAVPSTMVQTGSTMVILNGLPSWAGNTAAISLSVDGIAIPAGQIQHFTKQTIDHVTISPTTATSSSYATIVYTATAFSDATGTATVSNVAFTWTVLQTDPPFDPMSTTPAVFSIQGGALTSTATGAATVTVSAGGHSATASALVETVGTRPNPVGPGLP